MVKSCVFLALVACIVYMHAVSAAKLPMPEKPKHEEMPTPKVAETRVRRSHVSGARGARGYVGGSFDEVSVDEHEGHGSEHDEHDSEHHEHGYDKHHSHGHHDDYEHDHHDDHEHDDHHHDDHHDDHHHGGHHHHHGHEDEHEYGGEHEEDEHHHDHHDHHDHHGHEHGHDHDEHIAEESQVHVDEFDDTHKTHINENEKSNFQKVKETKYEVEKTNYNTQSERDIHEKDEKSGFVFDADHYTDISRGARRGIVV